MKRSSPLVKCYLCTAYVGPNSVCEHPKNGYCQVYLFQAEKDAKEVGMHPSIHTKRKEVKS